LVKFRFDDFRALAVGDHFPAALKQGRDGLGDVEREEGEVVDVVLIERTRLLKVLMDDVQRRVHAEYSLTRRKPMTPRYAAWIAHRRTNSPKAMPAANHIVAFRPGRI
jgi:hypothetical protein